MTIQTDQPDWTTDAAVRGDARVVGQDGPVSGSQAVQVNLLPTDRSLIVAVTPGLSSALVDILGGTSGIHWQNTSVNDDVSAGPAQFPVYGAVDPTVTVTIDPSAGNYSYYLIAVPDEAIAGVQASPLTVVNKHGTGVAVVESLPAGVGGNTVVLNNSNGEVLTGPVSPNLRVVDTISLDGQTVAGAVTFRLGSNTGQLIYSRTLTATASSNPDIFPNWYLTGPLWAAWSGAGALRISPSYHDVAGPT